jgi:hypothetical protein
MIQLRKLEMQVDTLIGQAAGNLRAEQQTALSNIRDELLEKHSSRLSLAPRNIMRGMDPHGTSSRGSNQIGRMFAPNSRRSNKKRRI